MAAAGARARPARARRRPRARAPEVLDPGRRGSARDGADPAALTFTEPPALAFTRVALHDSAGGGVAINPLVLPADDRHAVVTAIRGALAAGPYTVVWQVAGDDGHVTRGTFSFTVLPPAAPEPPVDVPTVATPTTTPPADGAAFDAQSPLYATVRWVQFSVLLIVVGAVAFERLVLGAVARGPAAAVVAPARTATAWAGLWVTGLVAVTAVLRLIAQGYAMRDPAGAVDATLFGPMLTSTVWGHGWLLQAAATVVAGVGFGVAARGRRIGWSIAALGALLLAFTPALSGHAAAVPRFTALSILADGVHVLGAGGWLGSLLFVVAVGVPRALRLPAGDRGGAVAALVHAFSPIALLCVALLMATGVFAAWSHLEAPSDLWLTDYGQLLFRKLVLFAVVAAIGAYNWLRLRPALGDEASAARLRRSATLELAIAVIVVAITAALVATPPPSETPSTQGSAAS